jgi:hypothetical protein
MRTLTIGIWTVAALAIALWMLPPIAAVAQRGTMAPAYVSGIVIGKPVHGERNVVLGTVENIVLNDSGCAKYLIISGKFSGARSRLYPIPWTFIARSAPDAIYVRVDEQVLVKAPSFEINRWPDFSQSEWENRIQTFYRAGAHATETEKSKPSAAVRAEEKSKAKQGMEERVKEWGKKATEGAGSAEQRGKSMLEKELKQKPVETGVGKSSGQRQMDLKTKEQTRHQKGQMMQQPSKMMEHGSAQQQMQRAPAHVEQGGSQTTNQGRLERGGAGQKGLQEKPTN